MIVIPMAGLSQRFTDAGYQVPKYMLDLFGETLFARTVGSFSKYREVEKFLFIARDVAGTRDFIVSEAKKLGVREFEIVVLDEATRGQAETVKIGLERAGVDPTQSLTIFNIDTIRVGFGYPRQSWMPTADGYLEVMRASDPGYSYAEPAAAGDDRVSRTAEKQVISDLASTGLYYFKQTADLFEAFEYEERFPSAPELYIAPLYNFMIRRGQDIRFAEVAGEDVIFCGTPDQYTGLTAAAFPR